ncbi:MAG: DUF488 family protein [Rubellimicrobium sp.]|nr:DUF488 family protein [Rubellimicrobium sp.]
MTAPFSVEVVRVYDDWQAHPGVHVFVDRLWPRGLSKDRFRPDEWLKDIAPSNELRKWYHADIEPRWPEFRRRYRAELDGNAGAMAHLLDLARKGPVALLTSTHDIDRSATVILRDVILERLEAAT